MLNNKFIFITGGNRGIGRGLVQKLSKNNNVIFSVRKKEKGEQVIKALSRPNLDYIIMDIDNKDSIRDAISIISSKYESIDILFNNAGILIPEYHLAAIETSERSILKTFQTNTLGPLRICKAIIPLMKNGGRIINISSGMGQLDEMEGGSTAYRLSKTALNALTKILSVELKNFKIKVNTICPGWVQTDMGGINADLSVREATEIIVKFSLAEEFPNGKFFKQGEEIPW